MNCIDTVTFKFHLGNIAEAFEKWRYSYERASQRFSPGFCLEFSECITDIGFHILTQMAQKYNFVVAAYPSRLLRFPLDLPVIEYELKTAC